MSQALKWLVHDGTCFSQTIFQTIFYVVLACMNLHYLASYIAHALDQRLSKLL